MNKFLPPKTTYPQIAYLKVHTAPLLLGMGLLFRVLSLRIGLRVRKGPILHQSQPNVFEYLVKGDKTFRATNHHITLHLRSATGHLCLVRHGMVHVAFTLVDGMACATTSCGVACFPVSCILFHLCFH